VSLECHRVLPSHLVFAFNHVFAWRIMQAGGGYGNEKLAISARLAAAAACRLNKEQPQEDSHGRYGPQDQR
jgi:hypothetical protein